MKARGGVVPPIRSQSYVPRNLVERFLRGEKLKKNEDSEKSQEKRGLLTE